MLSRIVIADFTTNNDWEKQFKIGHLDKHSSLAIRISNDIVEKIFYF